INAFIVSVLCIGLLKKKSFNSNEKILLFLGCARFGYFCIVWVGSFLLIIFPWLSYVQPIPQVLSAIHSFLNFSNVWVSSGLSVFYCIKIANFRHSCFTFLKAKIDRIVSWLLLGSVLLSLSISILVYKISDDVHINNPNATALQSFWKLSVKLDAHFFPLFFINGFVFATGFLGVIFSAIPLLFSLWTHKHRMQANSVKSVSVEAHIKAMKSILSFFFLYSINFTASVLSLVYVSKEENPVLLLIIAFQYNFPAVHSLVLIFSNPKLETTLLRTLICVKCKVC
ncbi:TA2R7 protein, partial [Centropus unirufus]|nr:TA2R7 protein [Centropus unirufus]